MQHGGGCNQRVVIIGNMDSKCLRSGDAFFVCELLRTGLEAGAFCQSQTVSVSGAEMGSSVANLCRRSTWQVDMGMVPYADLTTVKHWVPVHQMMNSSHWSSVHVLDEVVPDRVNWPLRGIGRTWGGGEICLKLNYGQRLHD